MAQVPYTEGVPQVNPEVNTPQDLQRIDVNSSQFGGAIGAGLKELGQGAERAKEFYNKAVVDEAYNDASRKMTNLLYGDPGKTIIGPDGSVQVDTGFLGKNGRDAMDGRPQAEGELEQIIQDGKNSLSTPEQQHEFEAATRRLQNYHSQQIGSHTNQQANDWYRSTNQSSSDLALNSISRNPYDMEHFNHSVADLSNAYITKVRLEGGSAADMQDATSRALRDATRARVQAIYVNNPSYAMKIVEANKDILGQMYEPLAMEVKSRSDKMIGDQKAEETMGKARNSMPYSNPNNPIFSTVLNQIQGGYSSPVALARTIQLESNGIPNAVSSGGGYIGLGQVGEREFKKYGPIGGSRLNPEDSIYATANLAKANAQSLSRVLGRYPTDAEIYLAHQQGAGGAADLLMNPNENAGDVVGMSHILNNVPEKLRSQAKSWTCAQFANYWIEKFNGHGGIDHPYGGPIVQFTKNIPDNQHSTELSNQSENIGTIQSSSIPTLGQEQVQGTPQISSSMLTQEKLNTMPTVDFVRAHALQSIDEDVRNGVITEDQADHARNKIIQKSNDEKMLEASTNSLKKQVEDKASNDLYTKMHDPSQNANILQEIQNSNDIDWKRKNELTQIATKDLGKSIGTVSSPLYNDTLEKITNGTIDSNADLYRLEIDGRLTSRDVINLSQALSKIQDSPEEKQLQKIKLAALKSIETEIVYNGNPRRRLESPEGRSFYDSEIVNRFESEFRSFRNTEEGKKNPYKFFDQKNIEKYYNTAPPISTLQNSAINAPVPSQNLPTSLAQNFQLPLNKNLQNPLAQNKSISPNDIIPVPPPGIDPKAWQSAVYFRPTVHGQPWSYQKWGAAISDLFSHPTPENIKNFDTFFKPSGITSRDIFEKIAPNLTNLTPKRILPVDLSMAPELGRD